MGTPAVQKCMELFLAYPFNNALHRHVTALLLAFDSGSDALVDFLLKDCKLLSWLISAPDQVWLKARKRLQATGLGVHVCGVVSVYLHVV